MQNFVKPHFWRFAIFHFSDPKNVLVFLLQRQSSGSICLRKKFGPCRSYEQSLSVTTSTSTSMSKATSTSTSTSTLTSTSTSTSTSMPTLTLMLTSTSTSTSTSRRRRRRRRRHRRSFLVKSYCLQFVHFLSTARGEGL